MTRECRGTVVAEFGNTIDECVCRCTKCDLRWSVDPAKSGWVWLLVSKLAAKCKALGGDDGKGN